MALQLTVDSLDSVPENVRALYTEADGKYRLDLEGYEDPAGLKSALQKEREAAKAASKRAGAWDAIGKTPEEVQAALAKQHEYEDQKLRSEQKFDELLEKQTERLRLDIEKREKGWSEEKTRMAAAMTKLRAGEVKRVLADAAVKAGALPEFLEDIVLRGISEGWGADEDGNVVATRDGVVALGKDGRSPLPASEWADSLRDVASRYFPRATGAGATGNPGGKATKAFSDMTEAEHVALYQSNPDRFHQLQAASKPQKA